MESTTWCAEAITFGIDPVTAIRMATLNPAEWFGLHDVGAIAPGRRADLFVFEDLSAPHARIVIAGGRVITQDAFLHQAEPQIPSSMRGSCRIDFSKIDLRIAGTSNQMRVIGSVEDQLVTDDLIVETPHLDGQAIADATRDILKMAVIERHAGTGNLGVGFVRGIGLARGAIAGTVAHDHHNLVTIGCDDESMLTAAKFVASLGGGLAVAEGSNVLASLPLPVAGLMSDRPIEEVRTAYDQLLAACRQLGSPLHDPFMAMSFMALEVIPKLKLTDRGLVDVTRFALVDLFV